MQVARPARRSGKDRRRALPIGFEPRADAVVRVTELRLDLVLGRTPARIHRAAIEQIDQWHAVVDQHIVAQRPRMVERDLDSSAALATTASTSATTEAPAAETTAARSAETTPRSVAPETAART